MQTNKINTSFAVNLYYSTAEGFYAKLPSELEIAFDRMTSDLMRSRGCFVAVRADKKTRGVRGDSADDAFNKAYRVFKTLLDDTVVERDVIILFFNNRATNFNDHKYNKEHPAISMQMGLTYCTEVVVSGDRPKYYQYSKYEAFGEQRISKKEICIYNDSCTIVPDTEVNREFLETIYNAIKALSSKLKDYAGTSDKLLELINSQQPLLLTS